MQNSVQASRVTIKRLAASILHTRSQHHWLVLRASHRLGSRVCESIIVIELSTCNSTQRLESDGSSEVLASVVRIHIVLQVQPNDMAVNLYVHGKTNNPANVYQDESCDRRPHGQRPGCTLMSLAAW